MFKLWLISGAIAAIMGLVVRQKRKKVQESRPEYVRTSVPGGEVVIDEPSQTARKPATHPFEKSTDTEIRSPG
tara:strand:- start:122 stop:340 length:219 start_codon:yes stop_codon:yes gene_type:complete